MWGILNTLNSSDVDEVTIDSGANWKATKINANAGIKVVIFVIAVLISFHYVISFIFRQKQTKNKLLINY